MDFKFFHAADIHLDSPLRGLARYDGAPVDELRGATRGAFKNLVSACIRERVAFLILAGDLYDGDWKDYNTGLFFIEQMGKLREAGIDVFVVRGNHDAQSSMSKALRYPENVHVFDDKEARSIPLARCNVVLHGQSYSRPDVTTNLAAHYPTPVRGAFNIGILHTNASGSPTEHKPYAPCSVRELQDRGYDYWALGHVHRRSVLAQTPRIIFPGNLQGRHINEAGPKGATLVTVTDGEVRDEHRSLDVVRWLETEIPIDRVSSAHDVVEKAHSNLVALRRGHPDRVLAVRVLVRGAGDAHSELLRDVARWTNEIRAVAALEAIWVERVDLRTRGLVDLGSIRAHSSPFGELLRTLDEHRASRERLEDLASELRAVEECLRRVDPDVGLRLDDPDVLQQLIDDAEQLLVQSFLETEEQS